ncbi:terminase gpA endonuclease subunit [Pseudescherichia sp.]|uniref:terminase gpA endonuclease subunit n=1 Tax=Pseudescherichia sp. TaxID=2055881 RepID=UPI0028AA12A9|nr:terminase gpA endonuclease subunit [Pseudescherichia sp.]
MKLHPYQIQPLNEIVNPKIRKIVLCSAAQMLKTSLMTASMCYLMANDSANMAYASSTAKETNQYVAAKLAPTIERSGLQALVTNKNDKSKANNQNQWQLANSDFVYFMNLNAASTLRSKTIKYAFLDECSNVDVDGSEGNPLSLAIARTAQFSDGKVILSSTPKMKDDLIMQEYNLSNQCKYFINCPHCDHEHEIVFENIKFQWKQIEGGRRAIPDADSARLECPECNHEITESERVRAVSNGRWIATNPEVTDVAGYNISRLNSPLTTIKRVVQEYAEAHYNFSLMTFYNNILGRPFEDEVNKELDLVLLENLRDPELDINSIPGTAQGLICSIDQQETRLECLTWAFDEHNVWLVNWRAFYSEDCTKIEAKAYVELDNYIHRTAFKTVCGRPLKVLGTFIDSSNGTATNTIYKWCIGKPLVYPIKGSSSPNDPLFRKSTKAGHGLILFNVNAAKTEVRKLLNGALSEHAEEMPVKIHFAHDLPDDWFMQMTSEMLKRKNGNLYWVLKPGYKRNEAIDLTGYCYAGMMYCLSTLTNTPFAELRKFNAKQKIINKVEEPTQNKPVKKPQRRHNWFGQGRL